jgi:hypothetical protein
MRTYIGELGKDFWANYRKTTKNAPSGKVFADLGMEEMDTTNGVTSLVFRKDRKVPEDGLIRIAAQQEPVSMV